MRAVIATILVILGYTLMATGVISGIGYLLYNWEALGLPLNVLAWVVGFIAIIIEFGLNFGR